MPSGYDALRASAAWLDLSARGRIYAAGKDRARLLHAITTNEVRQLGPGGGCYAFFLNAQGHILADVNLLCLADRFLLDTEPETRARLLAHVGKYIIADDVTLEDVTAALGCLAVEGPRAAALLTEIGAPLPIIDNAHVEWNGGLIQQASLTGQPGFRIFPAPADSARWIAQLESVGVLAASTEEARIVRLENGKPRYGEDIFETSLPQETRQMQAVSFTKGCYLGQEIVERIRSRGHVNRLLVRLEIAGETPLPAGSRLTANGSEAGEITSSIFSPALEKVVALAYVRAQYAAADAILDADGRAAVPSDRF